MSSTSIDHNHKFREMEPEITGSQVKRFSCECGATKVETPNSDSMASGNTTYIWPAWESNDATSG